MELRRVDGKWRLRTEHSTVVTETGEEDASALGEEAAPISSALAATVPAAAPPPAAGEAAAKPQGR